MNLTALKRHLSRYTAATMHPRQLDLTVNFFPRMSFGTNRIRRNTHTSSRVLPLRDKIARGRSSKYAWIFTDVATTSNPYPNFLGANYCTKLQQFIARCYVHKYFITTEAIGI